MTKFEWKPEHTDALDALIKQVATDPILTALDKKEPFELETDASAYAVRAALFQKDEQEKRCAVGYVSKTLNSAKQNYDIWDREFLGLILG